MNFARTILFAGLVTLAGAVPMNAQAIRDQYVEAELVAAQEAVQPGSTVWAALRLQHDEHWHTYYQNAGEAGYETSLEWQPLPDGVAVTGFAWPTPFEYDFSGAIVYVFDNEVFLPFEVSIPASAQPGQTLTLTAMADWLMCKDVCIPGGGEVTLALVVADAARESEWSDEIAATVAGLPATSSEWVTEAWKDDDTVYLAVAGREDLTPSDLVFIGDIQYIYPSEPQAYRLVDGRHVLQLAWTDYPATRGATELLGLVRSESGWGEGFPSKGLRVAPALQEGPPPSAILAAYGLAEEADGVAATMTAAPTQPFVLILLGAFLGGLILNLMPCVFPVLGLKVMGFVQQAGEDRKKVIGHGLSYTLGVLLSFWLLAAVLLILRAGGDQLGWGFQLQNPVFVFLMATLMVVFAMNMSGVFEIGGSLVGAGSKLQAKQGMSGSFFSGVLATVVATPCAAPFLAPALGTALSVGPILSIILFTGIALGLATPYLLLSAFPAAVKVLPRPGAWMETFRQAMAFPLYGFAGYLVYVLSTQLLEETFLNAILGLAVIALAVWIFGRWNEPGRSIGQKRGGLAVGALVLAGGMWFGWPSTPAPADLQAGEIPQVTWEEWAPGKAEALVAAGTPVYVDFTASWCVTCKVNKRNVFGSDEVHRQFYEKGIVALKADWSGPDPQIAQALESFGRSAVPFNLIYRPDQADPIILPELLTPGLVLDRLEGLPTRNGTVEPAGAEVAQTN